MYWSRKVKMKLVRVVGNLRWLYLIDLLHHKSKVKDRQDGSRIWRLSLETRHCNASKCLSNIKFAVLIWLKSVLNFMRNFDCLGFIWWVSVSESVFLEDFHRRALAKKEEYENQRKSLPKKRKNIPPLPSWFCSRSLVKNPDTIRAQSFVFSLVLLRLCTPLLA